MRYGNFNTITRQDTTGHYTSDAGELFEVAVRLLRMEREVSDQSVRLLGVSVTSLLRDSQLNLDLFGSAASAAPESN